MGDWIEDPREPSGWRHDENAPSPTPVQRPALPSGWQESPDQPGEIEVPLRIDDWCENRAPEIQLTDEDGVD